MNDQQGLAITSAGTVINHLHGGLTLARRGAADPQQLPTVYLLDVKALLRSSSDTGLAVIPWRDGEPRAFLLAATAPMRDWVVDQIDTGQPLWLPARAPDGAELLQSQPQDASPGETR
jgi:hypothetical protein